jgi:translation initiation factor 1
VSGNLVYDSDLGSAGHCPRCGRRRAVCTCGKAPAARPSSAPPRGAQQSRTPQLPRDGVVRISRDRKQRGGKVVTVIHGVQAHPDALAELSGELKRLCGSGGTVKDGVIEVQGDHRERVAAHLTRAGYRVKLAGG